MWRTPLGSNNTSQLVPIVIEARYNSGLWMSLKNGSTNATKEDCRIAWSEPHYSSEPFYIATLVFRDLSVCRDNSFAITQGVRRQ